MVQTWSNWKRFPDAQSGEHVEAPIGPGVYEVRHTMTGRVVAFGHSANVANALADLKLNGGVSAFSRTLPQTAVGLACRRPRVSHMRGDEPRGSQDSRATPSGPAPDRLASSHGHGLGHPPQLIPPSTELAAGHCAGRFVLGPRPRLSVFG